jgi:hypothetical protein
MADPERNPRSAPNQRLAIGGAVILVIIAAGAVLSTALNQPGYGLAAAGVGVVALFMLIARAKREQGK